jgi:hypothetical protein
MEVLYLQYSVAHIDKLREIYFTGLVEFYIDSGIYCYAYYKDGLYHKDDGPAIIFPDCGIYSANKSSWFLSGKRYLKEEWFELLDSEQKVKALFNEENW